MEKNQPVACYTYQGTETEEKHMEGMVAGHAYAVLDARQVKDSGGRNDRILKLRNPWGEFEWNGDWSDKSDKWTSQLRAELGVSTKEDGIFWMPWRKFAEYAQGLSICKVMPNAKYNSVYVDQKKGGNTSLIRIGIPKTGYYVISIDQMDSKFFKKFGYQLSYFRAILAEIPAQGKFNFVDCKFSPARNIFFEFENLRQGDYLLLVEGYWADKSGNLRHFVTSIYSEHMAELALTPPEPSLTKHVEYYLWRGLAERNDPRFIFENKGKFNVSGQRYRKRVGTNYEFGVMMYAIESLASNTNKAIHQYWDQGHTVYDFFFLKN